MGSLAGGLSVAAQGAALHYGSLQFTGWVVALSYSLESLETCLIVQPCPTCNARHWQESTPKEAASHLALRACNHPPKCRKLCQRVTCCP